MSKQKRTLGQGLVEFALLIPLVIFIFIGFIDLAWMTSSYLQLSSSVREVTRYAMVHPFDPAELENLVIEKATSLDSSHIDFIKFPDEYGVQTPAIIGNQVIIRASYDYQPITPVLFIFLSGENILKLTVQSSATLAPRYQ